MLLPSAIPLPCDAHSSKRVAHPNLITSTAYPPIQPALSAANGLLASCRALQAILASVPASAQTRPQCKAHIHASAPPPPETAARNEWHPFGHATYNPKIITLQTPPRGHHKRRRDEFEEDRDQSPNVIINVSDPTSPSSHAHIIYTTPKRHCKAPLLLPLGLTASDYDSLSSPELTLPGLTHSSSPTSSNEEDAPTGSLPLEDGDWTTSDDRHLVATVLSKLSLSHREWNDCARRLGKDKDSLGRRWQMLVSEGDVGLRRGMGRVRRTGLDIDSW